MSDLFALIGVIYNPVHTFKEISQRTVNNFLYYFIPILVSGLLIYADLNLNKNFMKQEVIVRIAFITLLACVNGSLIIHVSCFLIKKLIQLVDKVKVDYRDIRQVISYSSVVLILSAIFGLIMVNSEGTVLYVFAVLNILTLLWFFGLVALGISKSANIDIFTSIAFSIIPTALYILAPIILLIIML